MEIIIDIHFITVLLLKNEQYVDIMEASQCKCHLKCYFVVFVVKTKAQCQIFKFLFFNFWKFVYKFWFFQKASDSYYTVMSVKIVLIENFRVPCSNHFTISLSLFSYLNSYRYRLVDDIISPLSLSLLS